MNYPYKRLILVLVCVSFGLSTVSFGVTKQVAKKNQGLAGAGVKFQALENIKIEFNKRVSNNLDCTDLFQKLQHKATTRNADEVISFLMNLSKKHKKNVVDFSSDKIVQNEVIFEYLEHSSTPNGLERIALYEDIYAQTPTKKTLKRLLGKIYVESLLIPKNADPQIFYDKFRIYLATFDNDANKEVDSTIAIHLLAGEFWLAHEKYAEAIPFFKEIASNENDPEAKEVRADCLFELIKCYVELENFADAELSLKIYGPSIGSAWNQFKLAEAALYFVIADNYKAKAEYTDAINYYLKMPVSESVMLRIWSCYYEISTKNELSEDVLNKVLESDSAEVKFAGLHGIAQAKFKAKEYIEAYPYLKKQVSFFPLVQKPFRAWVDSYCKNDMYFMYGYCANYAGDSWDAVAAYKKIPENADAQYNLALIWINNPGIRSKRNAMEVIQKIKLLDKESYNILMDRYEDEFETKVSKN